MDRDGRRPALARDEQVARARAQERELIKQASWSAALTDTLPSATKRSAAWRGSARYVLLAVWAIRSASAARMTLRSKDATEAPACFAVARQ